MHLRVLHISTSDIIGGAARAAYRLHRGLLQVGIPSSMLVASKFADDESVIVPHRSRRLDLRLRRVVRRRLTSMTERRITRSLRAGLECFSTARSGYIGCWKGISRDVSVINLHWTAGFIDYPSFFGALPPDRALVWTLHDIHAFTGGCHYAGPCEAFSMRCGSCPQLDSTREWDDSRRTFNIKARAYARLNADRAAVVAPSTWIADGARRSTLLGRFQVEHIPYGLDLDVFYPRDRDAARKSFGFHAHERVILFVSDYLNNHRKGLDLLLSAIEGIEAKQNLVLLLVGRGPVPKVALRSVYFGRLESDLILSLAYNIADVFVIPSREEQFGQTAAEATACGCPVVGFAIGGVTDIVEQARTGFLAPPFDIRQLRDGIETAMVRRDAFSAACRARAERLFGLETQARGYKKLYLSLLERCARSNSTCLENITAFFTHSNARTGTRSSG
jgi:glycosyltransferase involved in cell wall biosynthesis